MVSLWRKILGGQSPSSSGIRSPSTSHADRRESAVSAHQAQGPTTPYENLDDDQMRVLILNGTRVAQLDHTHPNADRVRTVAISCDMEVASLKDIRNNPDKAYTALSYVWGADSGNRTVVVNGFSQTVTENLYNALWHIVTDRHTVLPYRLWVDVLCINQNDLEEKSQQVRFMGEIYQSARNVLIWLGTGAEQAGMGLDEFWEHFESKGKSTELSAANLQAGAVFLERSDWFQRSWTFQEVVLASDDRIFIRCGYHVVAWPDFVPTAQNMVTEIGEIVGDIESARKLMGRDRPPSPGHKTNLSLVELMALTAGRQARDSRDRIFALLGMYPHSESLKVSYGMDIDHIYSRVTFRIIKEMDNLCIIWLIDFRSLANKFRGTMNKDYLYAGLHSGLSARSGSILESQTHKSWVPMWDSIHRDYLTRILENDEGRVVFDMRRLHSAFHMKVSLDEDMLVAKGAILGYYTIGTPAASTEGNDAGTKPGLDIERFPTCLVYKESLPAAEPGQAATSDLLDTDEYVPRWFDAKATYRQLRLHMEARCSCVISAEACPEKGADLSESLPEAKDASAGADGNGGSISKILFSCVLFGFPEPLVIEPFLDAEKDEISFSLVSRYNANDVLYEAIDALSTGKSQIPQEPDSDNDSDNDHSDMPGVSPTGSQGGKESWKSPTEIIENMGLDVDWMPTTFKLNNRQPVTRITDK